MLPNASLYRRMRSLGDTVKASFEVRRKSPMYNLFIRPLVMAFALLCAVAMLGGAAAQTRSDSIAATVTFVDAKIGLMQLQLPEDKTLTMAASTQLLDDLKTGQRVNVVVTKKTAPHATEMPSGDTAS